MRDVRTDLVPRSGMRSCPGWWERSVLSAQAGSSVRTCERGLSMGSVIKKRRKRMAKKKHRKLLKKTRVQRRNKK
ncbi:hypothetical protein GCM10023205_56930 [Yinghuangia aomiensis]